MNYKMKTFKLRIICSESEGDMNHWYCECNSRCYGMTCGFCGKAAPAGFKPGY